MTKTLLIVCNPKTGWSNAEEIEVGSPQTGLEMADKLGKKYKFGLDYKGVNYTLVGKEWRRTSTNVLLVEE